MKNEADEYFASFTRLQRPEQCGDFTLTQVSFPAVNAKFPKKAIIKEFSQASGNAMREVGMLMELAAEPCHVIKYLHHIMAKGKVYIFLEFCPKTLAREIFMRKKSRQFWTEPEVLVYMRDMLQTLKVLHVKRIVHRNINPSTILLQDSAEVPATERKMKLAHFQDSKQIHVGLTMQMSSVHGFETFLSPQHYQALKNGQEGVTYEITYKDDIWSLGRTFYDMLTLKNNEDVVSLFDEGERGFSTCLTRELKALRYSPALISMMLNMLTLDNESRYDAVRLLSDVQKIIDSIPKCEICEQYEGTVGRLIQPCEHLFCEICVGKMIEKAVRENGTLDSLKCVDCERSICAQIEREVTNVQLRAQLDSLRLNNQVRCSNEGCDQMHSQLLFKSGRAKAYLVVCVCGAKYCSYCHNPGGHGLFGVLSKCPRLPLA